MTASLFGRQSTSRDPPPPGVDSLLANSFVLKKGARMLARARGKRGRQRAAEHLGCAMEKKGADQEWAGAVATTTRDTCARQARTTPRSSSHGATPTRHGETAQNAARPSPRKGAGAQPQILGDSARRNVRARVVARGPARPAPVATRRSLLRAVVGWRLEGWRGLLDLVALPLRLPLVLPPGTTREERLSHVPRARYARGAAQLSQRARAAAV